MWMPSSSVRAMRIGLSTALPFKMASIMMDIALNCFRIRFVLHTSVVMFKSFLSMVPGSALAADEIMFNYCLLWIRHFEETLGSDQPWPRSIFGLEREVAVGE